jgi:hypothetical protein
MAEKKAFIDELNYVSGQISTEVRTINLGVLGTAWALLVTSSNGRLEPLSAGAAILIIGLCILSIVCHLLQYVAGYQNADVYLCKMEKQGLNEFQYDKKEILYRMRIWLFWLKIVFALFAAGILIVALIKRV